MLKWISKGDVVSLIFINAISEETINILDANDLGQTPEILDCYRDLIDVFSQKESQTLPPHRGALDHHIPLEDGAKPAFSPIYNLSELELKVLKQYLEEKLKNGSIRPSTSPFGSPVLFVKKPDGSLRLCRLPRRRSHLH